MPEGTRQLWAASGRLPEGIIYPELIHGGMVETLVQNTDAFNAASNNTIRLVTARRRGDFAQESFFKNVASIVNRRGVAGSPENPAVASNPVPMDEFVSVKLNRRVGPIDQTLDSFRKLGNNADLEVLSRLLGAQIAKAIQIDQLETALRALSASINNVAALTTDKIVGVSPDESLNTNALVDGLATFGDAGSNVVMWVMHSKAFYDLVKDQISLNIDGISNFNVATATPVTLNRPVLVTDSPALTLTNYGSPEVGTAYVTLGLVQDACVLEDSEEESLMGDLITGKDNLVVRLQGEFAYNTKLKGFAWDVANGGVNPDDTAVGTGTNWDSVMDNNKDLAGFSIITT